LNAHCFNGVYRTNQSGAFNVPMGTKTAGVPSEEHLVRCSVALRKAHLVCQDYMETLRQCTSTDFVYLDPPYPKSDSRDRGEYGIGAFNPDEETRLVAALKQLDRNGTKFLLSYKLHFLTFH
jgi:DNA adenine methylase